MSFIYIVREDDVTINYWGFQMVKMLILDTNKGALDKMMESTDPDQGGRHPDFGAEILEIARSL